MSSGFVSGGTSDQPIERDDAWLRAQQELEEERRRKAEIGQQNGGKSLYEMLEQNKSECWNTQFKAWLEQGFTTRQKCTWSTSIKLAGWP